MGDVRWGPPAEVISALRHRYDIECFVETGTHLGEACLKMAPLFAKIITIELAEAYFEAATHLLANTPNVLPLLGHSVVLLRELLPSLPPTLFWLDAHYSGGPTAGVGDECPLLEEIAVIAPDLDRHFVMIDDARLFIGRPPPPFRTEYWPDLKQITAALVTHHPMSITVFQDVILAVPERHGDEVLSMLVELQVNPIHLAPGITIMVSPSA
jgi:hypothetical protein